MSDPNQTVETPTPKEALNSLIATKDKEGLHAWIEFYFKINIPQNAITPRNTAPFDFVADYIFGEFDSAVVLANRSGGKTLNFGILDTLMAYISPRTEIATVGAIQAQAKKGYEYFSNFSGLHPFALNIESLTMNRTKCKNDSLVQILTGTMSGVNSPHPQLLFLDEIDLMSWQILQQAFSMPLSKHGVRARMVMTSTRKFAGGVMQRMMTEAKERGLAVYQWNIWDVVKPLPRDNPALMKLIEKTFGSSLPENIEEADGFYDWEDLITKYQTLDPETWETEWLCQRPGLQGVIYGSAYDDDNNLITEWTPPNTGYIYLWEDFGYAEDHPDVVLPVWIPTTFDRAVIFDERYMVKYSTDEIWKEVDEMLAQYGYQLPNRQESIQGNIKGWVGDPHGLSEINERKVKGAPMMEKNPDAKLYLIDNGIPIVRKFLTSGRLMITEKCINLRVELLSYSYKKNVDGTFSKTTVKKLDHGPDAIRYGLIAMGELIRSSWFSRMYKSEQKRPQSIIKPKKKDDFIKKSFSKPLTAGFLDMEF